MNARRVLGVVGALLIATAISGCAVESAPAPAAAPAQAAPVATTDAQVCGDLGRLGRAFQEGTLKPYIATASFTAPPIEIAAQLAALTTIGAPKDEIDGTATISMASLDVRTKMFTMIRNAERLSRAIADATVGGSAMPTWQDMKAMMDSFAAAGGACHAAGYTPAYFAG